MLSLTLFALLLTPVTLVNAINRDYYFGDRTQWIKAKRITATAQACNEIAGLVSSKSAVFYPSSPDFNEDIAHFYSSSTEVPVCVVEPGSDADVAVTLKVLANRRVPFAVESAGHATNPDFSSTTEVHISLTRFNQVILSADKSTVEIGTGQTWLSVYTKLQGTGRIVLGGRVPSVGVGGFFAYGGGFSWHSNQYGLGVDLMKSYKLVKPDSTIVTVCETPDSILFNALKGSGNNFGIITSFTVETVPFGETVYGGVIGYDASVIPAVSTAVAKFTAQNTDNKAAMLPSYITFQGQILMQVQLFYDGPSPPPSVFADFLAIPSTSSDLKARSYLNHLNTTSAGQIAGLRGYFHTMPSKRYTVATLQKMMDILTSRVQDVLNHGIAFTITPEPFTLNAFKYSSGKEAFLHTAANACFPTSINANWILPSEDAFWQAVLKDAEAQLRTQAQAQGDNLSKCPYYPNYSLFDTSLQKMYLGQLTGLKILKKIIDPKNVMGLTGGFKF